MKLINLPDGWRLAGIRTTAELMREGNSAAQINTLVRQGALVQVRRGVYARAEMAAQVMTEPGGDHLLQTAGMLATLGPAVASHESAAIIHYIDLLATPRIVTLTRPPGGNRSARARVRFHYAQLPTGHETIVYGMRVTTVARTVIDLARTLEFRAGVVTADSALRLKLVTKSELESVLADLPRRTGRSRAAEVIAFADGRAESVLESLARVVFRDCGLPPPDLQVWVGGPTAVGRVDFLWRQHRTVAEVDGMMKYKNPERAVLQLERDRQLRDAGYEVVHFTWQDITENPAYVATTVRSAFRRAARPQAAPARPQAAPAPR
jgi:predicted transcriptional regulator of viral defense system